MATDPPGWEHKAELTVSRMSTSNSLEERAKNEPWMTKRLNWRSISEVLLPSFPRLTEEDLKEIALGSYQLQLAREYTNQHVKKKSPYQIQIHHDKEDENIIRVKIGSRMSSHSMHNALIEFVPFSVGPSSIKGKYCSCKVGSRTVGLCAHLCSVIWFLSYARHRDFSPRCYELANNILNAADLIAVHSLEEFDSDADSDQES